MVVGARMNLLTQTGINLLDMIDLQEVSFSALLDSIYKNTNTALFKDVLTKLRNNYSEKSTRVGCHVIRYLLLNLREETIESVLPTQLAYAVSIHKAQGLEYDSVKVIIPQSNSEKITHGIFYTAITRAKKKLKIYWSAETMKEIVSGFATNESNGKSLEIVKAKLAVTQ